MPKSSQNQAQIPRPCKRSHVEWTWAGTALDPWAQSTGVPDRTRPALRYPARIDRSIPDRNDARSATVLSDDPTHAPRLEYSWRKSRDFHSMPFHRVSPSHRTRPIPRYVTQLHTSHLRLAPWPQACRALADSSDRYRACNSAMHPCLRRFRGRPCPVAGQHNRSAAAPASK